MAIRQQNLDPQGAAFPTRAELQKQGFADLRGRVTPQKYGLRMEKRCCVDL